MHCKGLRVAWLGGVGYGRRRWLTTCSPRRPRTRWRPTRRWRRGCGRGRSTTSSGRTSCWAPGQPLRTLVEGDRLSSVILWGPPGTGKTTLAQAIAAHTSKAFEQLSAVSAGVKDVRDVLERAKHRLGERGQGTILFLDEVHRFSKSQQDALLPGVESGLITLIGATTENPFFEVNPPLLSRSTLFRLNALDLDAARAAARSGASRPRAPPPTTTPSSTWPATPTATAATCSPASRWRSPSPAPANKPPARHPRRRRGRPRHQGPPLRPRRALRRDLRVHQEHPRLRPRRRPLLAGPDAGGGGGRPLHRPPPHRAGQRGHRRGRPAGAARGGGGGPRRRARRPARGPAQPGPGGGAPGHRPQVEPRRPSASGRPWRTCATARRSRCPVHLRDAHYQGAQKLGHGAGYDYPHDHPEGWVPQRYLPDELGDRTYYDPSPHGFEQEIRTRMEHRSDPMTATELAALIVAIASVVAVVLLAVVLVSIAKTLREVRTRRRAAPHGDRARGARPRRHRPQRQRRARAGRRRSSAPPSRSGAPSTPPRASPTSRSPTRSSRCSALASGTGRAARRPAPQAGAVAVFRRLFWLFLGVGFGFGALVLGDALRQGDGRPLPPRAGVGRPGRRHQGLRRRPAPGGRRRPRGHARARGRAARRPRPHPADGCAARTAAGPRRGHR